MQGRGTGNGSGRRAMTGSGRSDRGDHHVHSLQRRKALGSQVMAERKNTDRTGDREISDEHIVEAIGRTRVVIRAGSVVEVGEPCITECPLARRFAVPVTDFTPEAIRANIENRIRSFGMCTERREVKDDRDRRRRKPDQHQWIEERHEPSCDCIPGPDGRPEVIHFGKKIFSEMQPVERSEKRISLRLLFSM